MARNLKAHIGARVREARQKAGMTQADVAARLEKAVETISNVERGATWTSLETLERMSLLFDERVEFFFEGYSTTHAKSRSRLRIEAEVSKLIWRLGDGEVEVVRDLALSLERQMHS
ncbi:MAG: helix-turn-helix transcriptional regulator [Pseudomonadota bacterium]